MILQNIQSLAEETLDAISQTNDKSNIKAALQACYYNLNNLHTSINQKQTIIESKLTKQKANNIQTKQQITILPELSVFSMNKSRPSQWDKQNVRSMNDHCLSLISKKKLRGSNRKKSERILDKTRKQEIIQKFNKYSGKQILSSKIKEKQKSINFLSFRHKIKPLSKIKENGLKKNQKYFQDQQVMISENVIDRLGLYNAGQLYKNKNINKFIDEQYHEKMKPVMNLRFASLGTCSKDQLFLTQNSDFQPFNESFSEIISTFDPKTKVKQNFKIAEVIKQKYTQQAILQKQQQLLQKQQQQKNLGQDCQIKNKEQQKAYNTNNSNWIITISNYEIIRNQQFLLYKCKHIENWSQISFIFHEIMKYLKKTKIANICFKFEPDKFMKHMWSSKKIKFTTIEQLLKIRSNIRNLNRRKTQDKDEVHIKNKRIYNTKQEIIREIVVLWRDRKNLQIKKKDIMKRREVLVRLALRMIVRFKIKKNMDKKIQRIQEINKKLVDGVWIPDVQIYLPSFSEEQFIRKSTQYMDSYENMFYHIWSSSAKHIILILPAVNESLLQIFQQRMKMRKNITIICPDSHQIYPKNLPLAAYLLYSKHSIEKIKKILYNKKGIIIPGRLNQNQEHKTKLHLQYELNLSDLLMIPLYTNTKQRILSIKSNSQTYSPIINKKLQQQQFNEYGFATLKSIRIQCNSSHENILSKFSQLIVNNKNIKIWVFKINGQFNGRGIAIFDAHSSKKLKDILVCDSKVQDRIAKTQSKRIALLKQQLKLKVNEYLHTYFRLKLKINFENCIYRTEQFINKFMKYGGIIQQYFQDCQTYEFCFRNQTKKFNSNLNIIQEQKIRLLASCKNYCVDFVNKASLFNYKADFTYQKEKQLEQFQQNLFQYMKQKYLIGYVSVVSLYNFQNKKMYILQIKPYLTHNSCISQYLCWKQIKQSRKAQQQAFFPQRTSLRFKQNQIISTTNQLKHLRESSLASNNTDAKDNQFIKTYFNDQKIHLFIPTIIFTDVDEGQSTQIIETLIKQTQQEQEQVHKIMNQQGQIDKSWNINAQYLSLGLSLSLLFSGQANNLKKIKSKAISQSRNLSQKIELYRLYRGKQQIRDVFRFGDIIRAITQIK